MRKIITLSTLIIAFLQLNGQVVTTFAGAAYFGGGEQNATPNNPKMDEKYSKPSGLAIDGNGKIYVTDEHNIQLIDGATSRIRGGYLDGSPGYDNSSSTLSGFNTPSGMAVMSDNSVLIADQRNHLIRKVSAFSTVGNAQLYSTFCGSKQSSGGYADGAYATARFNQPYDIAITSTGVIYVSDAYNNCIRKISGGQVTTVAGIGTQTEAFADGIGNNARFAYPMGLFLENDNSLLIVDRNNGKLRRLNLTTREVSTVISSGLSPEQSSDVVAVDGMIYIADFYCIRQWDGTNLTVFAGSAGVDGNVDGTGSSARFGELELMTYDATNKCIYVADRAYNVIKKVTVSVAPKADFIANNTNVTIGQTVKLSNKSLAWKTLLWAISPNTYTLLNGTTLTDSVVYVKFTAAGAYQVSLTASNSSGNDTKTKTSYINVSNLTGQAPTADFAADKTSAVAGVTVVTLSDYSSNSPTSWEWTITPVTFSYTGGTTMNSQFPKVIFNAAGTYTVTLKATNGSGNNSTTKNNYITVGVNSLRSIQSYAALVLFPSPASSKVTLVSNVEIKKVSLTSLEGKTVLTGTGNEINVSGLPSGFYLVICQDALGQISRQKLQVQH